MLATSLGPEQGGSVYKNDMTSGWSVHNRKVHSWLYEIVSLME